MAGPRRNPGSRARTGKLTFARGETSKSVIVAILGDTTVGSAQEVRINLRATYADGLVVENFGYGIIWNADGYPDPYGGGWYDPSGGGYY